MKFFFFILSCFMLSLSCLPCSDGEECNTKPVVEISVSKDNHQEHNHDKEACTPFCSCSCCAASVFYSPLAKQPTNKVVFHTEKHPALNVPFNTEVYYTIWQPPKIS